MELRNANNMSFALTGFDVHGNDLVASIVVTNESGAMITRITDITLSLWYNGMEPNELSEVPFIKDALQAPINTIIANHGTYSWAAYFNLDQKTAPFTDKDYHNYSIESRFILG